MIDWFESETLLDVFLNPLGSTLQKAICSEYFQSTSSPNKKSTNSPSGGEFQVTPSDSATSMIDFSKQWFLWKPSADDLNSKLVNNSLGWLKHCNSWNLMNKIHINWLALVGWMDFVSQSYCQNYIPHFCWRMSKYHKTFPSGLCEKTPPLLSRSSEGVSEHGFFTTEKIQVNVISQNKKTAKIFRKRATTTTPPRKWTWFFKIYPDVYEVYQCHGVTSVMFPKSGNRPMNSCKWCTPVMPTSPGWGC